MLRRAKGALPWSKKIGCERRQVQHDHRKHRAFPTDGTNLLFIKAVIEDRFQHSTFINPEVEMEKLAIVTLRQRYLPCRMSHARMGQIQYEWKMI